MTGPPAATAAVRVAVRRALADLPPGEPVLAAVSGGADSLALAAGLAAVRPGSGAVVVDHGLQPGSAAVAARAAGQCEGLGLAARVVAVDVRGRGEAAAREARLAALQATGAVVLLGHTRDDQAEQVLLGLARGAGARSLAGMPAVRGPLRRPLLALPRDLVRSACRQAGLQPWEDPHNADGAYARVRVRRDVLPALEQALGPGVAAALARSAAALREGADALDALAAVELARPAPADPAPADPALSDPASADPASADPASADPALADPALAHPGLAGAAPALDAARLAALPAAVRARVLKRWAEAGCGGAVGSRQVAALRALVEDWSGQGPVALPGGVRVARRAGRLAFLP